MPGAPLPPPDANVSRPWLLPYAACAVLAPCLSHISLCASSFLLELMLRPWSQGASAWKLRPAGISIVGELVRNQMFVFHLWPQGIKSAHQELPDVHMHMLIGGMLLWRASGVATS